MNTSRDSTSSNPTLAGIRTSTSLLASAQQHQFQQQQQISHNQQQRHRTHRHQNCQQTPQKFGVQQQQPPAASSVISRQPPPLSYLASGAAVVDPHQQHCKIHSTATHIELEEPCGLTTFLTGGMSCRGRAEAFARRLQSRLRTLGQDSENNAGVGMVGVDQTDSGSWLNGNPQPTEVTSLQPSTTTSSGAPLTLLTETNAADSYFDFDIEPESPGSPIDECEYTRLIETTATTPQDVAPESGFVCASPCSTQESADASASSGSDLQYFDPDASSETDAANQSNTSAEYFDCQPEPHKTQQLPSHSFLYQSSKGLMPFSLSSGSTSSSSLTSKLNGHLTNDSCSDSLPPSQSTEFTSSDTSNSTLQDTDGDIGDATSSSKVAFAVAGPEDDQDELLDDKNTLTKYCESKTKFIKYNEADDDDEEEEEEASCTTADDLESEATEQSTGEMPAPDPSSSQTLNLSVCDVLGVDAAVQDTELPTIQIDETETEPEGQDEDSAQPIEALGDEETAAKAREGVSDEEEYERPQRVRRCSSLKTGKTPPGTPGRKKIVRFADVLGLDLADVRTFLDEVPKVPRSAFEDLEITMPGAQPVQLGPPLDKVLVPMFQQPGALPAFLEKVRDKQVCLENAAVTDPISLTITGTVRVRNLDFHKSVHIRYSLDNWRSYSDLTANYVENSCDGFSDKFTFILFGNSLQVGQRIEMAIRFQAKGEQFWDNNYGANYCFQCLPCNTMRSMAAVPSTSCDTEQLPIATPPAPVVEHVKSIDLPHREWANAFLY